MKLKISYLVLPFALLSLSSCWFLKNDKNEATETSYTIGKSEYTLSLNIQNKNVSMKEKHFEEDTTTDTFEYNFLEDGSLRVADLVKNEIYYYQYQSDNSYAQIEKKGNEWYVTKYYGKYDYEELIEEEFDVLYDILADLKTLYNLLSYNEEAKTYSFADNQVSYQLKFENNLLRELKAKRYDFDGIISFYDYGTTTINFEEINPIDNIYVKNKVFTYVEGHGNVFTEAQWNAFNVDNQESTLTFNSDGTFSMNFKRDFLSIDEKTYTGTYTFEKYTPSVSVLVVEPTYTISVSGTYRLDPENYVTGGYLDIEANFQGNMVYITFQVK